MKPVFPYSMITRVAELGPNSSTLISYLERNGAPKCPANANPAEWMLESTSPGEGALNWFEIWRSSPEYKEVQAELQRLRDRSNSARPGTNDQVDASQHQEFVAPITVQSWEVLKRTAAHYWRSPTYIYSKASLAIFSVSGYMPSHLCSTMILTEILSHYTSASASAPRTVFRAYKINSMLFLCF